MKDYDCTINYHLGKANVVADALSRKSQTLSLALMAVNEQLVEEARRLHLELLIEGATISLATLMTPLYWDEVGERCILGPELIRVTCEKVDVIKEQIKVSQSRQKIYVDTRLKDLEFSVGEKVFIQVSPTKGVMCFNKKGKLSLRFIRSYEILVRIRLVAYMLELPPALAGVHDVFHLSMLRKYIPNLTHVLTSESSEPVANLAYEEVREEILNCKDHSLCNYTISFIKVRWRNWRNHLKQEASWEREEEMQPKYPHLFGLSDMLNFMEKIS
ncbi:uncharacterized protein LOC122662927 [Telopea speciosissima]|uniref:uncharacterized protein LOC122662927 n=1 Tax=Telopea speciosissima TaxID=54955 RepID=UPI001CC50C6D|nr:uncharacterized protein LOC122662927 [Telopea speciosissima]